MSETQAIEPETKIDNSVVAVVPEVDADGNPVVAAPEAIEIKVEDGDQPSSKKVSRVETRLRNKNAQISAAEALAQKTKEELDAANAQIALFQLRDKQQKAPVEDDFDDPRDYQQAANAYNDKRIEDIAERKADEKIQQNNQRNNQVNQSEQQGQSNAAHYKRADSLPITNYDQLEGNAMSIFGEQFIQTIIETTDDSELIIASLGASPGKAGEIAALSNSGPQGLAKAFAKAVKFPINSNLKGPSLKTPDPETKIKPGESTQLSGWDLKLDKARDKAAVSGDFSYITEVKKQARAAGVEL